MVEISLICALVGEEEYMFEVKIDSAVKVMALKVAIENEVPGIQCDPNALQLYLAKTMDGKWLPGDESLDVMIQCGVFPCKMEKMHAVWKLQDMRLFGTGDSLGQGVVHVLVVLPGRSLSIGATPVAAAAGRPHDPHPARKRRWEALNEVLDSNKKAKSEIDADDDDESSTDNSNLSVSDFKSTMKAQTDTYELQPKATEDEKIDALYAYLLLVTKALGRIVGSKDVIRLYLILPILAWVCSQFEGDAQISVEEKVAGKRVHADSSFDFVVQRGRKCLGVVLPKREDFTQGLAKAYIGCEVFADVEGSTEAYSVVTNYKEWYFSRSLVDKIERTDEIIFMRNGIASEDGSREDLLRTVRCVVISMSTVLLFFQKVKIIIPHSFPKNTIVVDSKW